MDERERTRERPEDQSDDENAKSNDDTEGNLMGYGQTGQRRPDPGRENPTGREESGDEGGESIIPKR